MKPTANAGTTMSNTNNACICEEQFSQICFRFPTFMAPFFLLGCVPDGDLRWVQVLVWWRLVGEDSFDILWVFS
jgi:hypothetical protein